ncbi:hypothetical protein BDY21DRAFT_337772 [Lineolata rhizophorae]|uniref:Protein kinase domain-containing protein n=1 Tax=Lineolata rhizophorae TaxID=578093 RepID=A0A6A6P8Q6_9PEZI|nr:hypothetical protein BDY21DRAFT_337772 [Lineolata rhizophorae]
MSASDQFRGSICLHILVTLISTVPIIMKVECSTRAIHDLEVVHNCLMPRNMPNEDTGQVMVIDFESSMVSEPQPVPGVISAYQKRGRDSELRRLLCLAFAAVEYPFRFFGQIVHSREQASCRYTF